ncbi:MAG: DUF4065 domain-containing protein [Candidatus Thermoplasmatota archaeon]|nr:DUF4065 domain-containing protein [Candidatus Thermoplasmatota archaeon]MDH7506251.1 DUF4065 domain-containing protein [Candidatus Thermoplasmatota archaeon]
MIRFINRLLYLMYWSDRLLPTYDLADIEKAINKLKEEQIMSLSDLVLSLFYAHKDQPIRGMILLMKEIFLMQMEFVKEENIKLQNAEFIAYKYGPYSIDVDKIIDAMEDYGLLISRGRKSTNKEIFYLTRKGEERAEEAFGKLNKHQQEKLKDLRKGWDQLGVNGILKLVYTKYPNYTKESEIIKRVLRNEKVSRIRG